MTICFLRPALFAAGWLGLCLAVAAPSEGAQSTFRDAAVKAYLDEFANAGPINGVVLVGQQGRVVAAGAYGKANFAYDTPNALDTRFEIASITKTFTAQLVMKLVNEGKIQLSSTIRTYLPGFPAGWADRVTIGQLLTHTAGVQGDIADFPTTGHNFPGVVAQINADLFSLDELLKLVAAPRCSSRRGPHTATRATATRFWERWLPPRAGKATDKRCRTASSIRSDSNTPNTSRRRQLSGALHRVIARPGTAMRTLREWGFRPPAACARPPATSSDGLRRSGAVR